MNYVAAFRTYTWNEHVRDMAEKFFKACPLGRHVILADETRGPLGISGYEVISHTEDTNHLGLLVHPKGKSLWFNVDYGIYILRVALPGFSYYLLSESDVAVNLPLEPMIQAAVARGLDFIAHDIRPSTPDWRWHANGQAISEQPWRSILFFMLISARAADLLHQERRRHKDAMEAGRMTSWPFCEPFVPTILNQAGLRMAGVSDFADTTHLRYRPRIPLDDPRATKPGSLAHSVVSTWEFFKLELATNPRSWLTEGSPLRHLSERFRLEEYSDLLMETLRDQLDHAALAEVAKLLAEKGMPVAESADLAFCKPSLTSSVSRWSRHRDRIKDAAGANGGTLHPDYGFHTDIEESPWWMVDLLGEYALDRIEIVNRSRSGERFVQFLIESSLDGHAWTNQYAKLDLAPVSSSEAEPFHLQFRTPFIGRFVRLRLLGKNCLHLRQVRLFGRKLAAP